MTLPEDGYTWDHTIVGSLQWEAGVAAFVCLSVFRFFTGLFICLFVHLSCHLSIHPSIHPSFFLPFFFAFCFSYLFAYLSFNLPQMNGTMRLPAYPSSPSPAPSRLSLVYVRVNVTRRMCTFEVRAAAVRSFTVIKADFSRLNTSFLGSVQF